MKYILTFSLANVFATNDILFRIKLNCAYIIHWDVLGKPSRVSLAGARLGFQSVFLWAVVAPKFGEVAAKSELAQSFQVP